MVTYLEKGTNYAYTIKHIKDITFKSLRNVVIDFTKRLPSELANELYKDIQHGVCQLESEPELNMYLHALGLMHEAKLQHAFEHLSDAFINHEAIEIIDYGCGQAIGTMCYADFLRKNGHTQEVRKITLIEPSEIALKRAALHVSVFFPNADIATINKGFDDLVADDFCKDAKIPTLHIFSNVLDLAGDYFNLKSFAYLLRDCIIDENQFVCVEPYFGCEDLDEYPYLFFKYLNIDDKNLYYSKIFKKGSFVVGRDWSCHIIMGYEYIYSGWSHPMLRTIKCIDEDGALEEWEANRAAKEGRFEDAYKLYEISAQKGNTDAYYLLGEYKFLGKGIEKNDVEAIKWYRKAAEAGQDFEQATLRLAECYRYGIGVVENKSEAVKYYKKAAEYGCTEAEVTLGEFCLSGEGVEQDYEDAVRHFRRAAYYCNAESQYYLGLCYEEGKGVKSIPSEGVKWYRKAAEQGHAEAQKNLGNCYYNGHGVVQDYTEAVKWYRKAAEQGHAEAQNKLGNCYNKGHGVLQDDTEAVKWYLKAAEQGYAKAQHNLGTCYYKGHGVLQDYAEAVKWYLKAVEQGYAIAQANLGNCYYKGHGVLQDYTEAVKWYLKAAEQGYAIAQKNLGVCYYNGHGVLQDYTEAVKWYLKAAEQGYAIAQDCLGICYYKGHGVLQDCTEAVKWYLKAAEQGFKPAQETLDKLNSEILNKFCISKK